MAAKSLKVFGDPVDVLITAEMTDGRSTTMTQTSPPAGGPSPQNEDESFFVLKGEYEFLYNGEWRKVGEGETVYATRGSVHTFRNAGSTTGRILIFVTPGGFEKYLEEISPLSIPADMPQLLAISERYGISFPT